MLSAKRRASSVPNQSSVMRSSTRKALLKGAGFIFACASARSSTSMVARSAALFCSETARYARQRSRSAAGSAAIFSGAKKSLRAPSTGPLGTAFALLAPDAVSPSARAACGCSAGPGRQLGATARANAAPRRSDRPRGGRPPRRARLAMARCSEMHQVQDFHRPAEFDALARGDAGQTGHGTRPRIGKPHVLGNAHVVKQDVAQPIVAAAMPAFGHGHFDALPFAEALGEKDVGLVFDRPRLAFVIANVEAPLLAIERYRISFIR